MVRVLPIILTRHGIALGMLCGLSVPGWAANGAALSPLSDEQRAVLPGSPGQPLDFDIPAQPLADALKQYAVLSNWPTLFQNAMVSGRVSSPVRGRYLPETALHRLLDGTGLIAEKVGTGPGNAFILKEISAPALAPSSAPVRVDFNYGASVQAGIWDSLCADPLTAGEDYRALLRFGVDAGGAVQQVRLLGSTGNARRDAALLEALQRVRVRRSPPVGMAQPLTMLILPREPGSSDSQQRCGGDNRVGVEAARP